LLDFCSQQLQKIMNNMQQLVDKWTEFSISPNNFKTGDAAGHTADYDAKRRAIQRAARSYRTPSQGCDLTLLPAELEAIVNMPTPPYRDRPTPDTSTSIGLDDPIALWIILAGGLNLLRGASLPMGLPGGGGGAVLDPTD